MSKKKDDIVVCQAAMTPYHPRPKLSVASVYWTYTASVYWGTLMTHCIATLGLPWLHYSVCTVYTAMYAQCIH